MSSNVFLNATKSKYRFKYKGFLSVEDLWELSLEDLDNIYKSLKKMEKDSNNEESLLTTTTKGDKVLSDKIEIVKIIFQDKLETKERIANAAKKRAQNQKILEIMADKKDAALKEKSLEELEKMLVDEDA